MSLRLRLVLLTLLLVTLVVVSLSALHLQTVVESLTAEVLRDADLAGEQTLQFVIGRIETRTHEPGFPGSENDDQTRQQWFEIVSTDPDIRSFLLRRPIQTKGSMVQEINIADPGGHILASVGTNAVGTMLHPWEPLPEWSRLPWYSRAYDLLSRRPTWEVSPPVIGIRDSGAPVLKIQVVASGVLARDALLPRVQRLGIISASALLVSLVIALLATQSALRPLRRIERTIDRIVQGSFEAGETHGKAGKEFQAVENKLDLLGQRMLGVQAKPIDTETHKLEALVENVALQFDVAQRLSAISRLSSGVAHEIKNPLNAILLRLDLLKVRLGDSDEEVSEELAVLSREVLRLNRVVTTFLDFSRPVEVHYEDVDLAALVREVTELIRPQADLANIALECVIPAEPASMRGDPDLLKQAILNLVTNAVEAMSPGGGQLRVSVTRKNDSWVLEVTDSGPGIPPELRDKVFQLYFTSKAKGSGIGLAMTYRATQLHNGTIGFVSESGRGTTFHLEFPVAVTHA
jgi:signal transduction histidine kinase